MAKLSQLILTDCKYPYFNIILTVLLIFTGNISLNGINSLTDIIFIENLPIRPDSTYVIVLDPGHGGKDKGTSYKNIYEKDITLSIVKKIKKKIKQKKSNIDILLTRDEDVFVPIYERIRIANRSRSDLFVSIHINSYQKDKHVNGNEVYIMGLTDSEENLQVAMRENASVLLEGEYQNNYDWYDPSSTEAYIFLSAYQNLFLNQSVALARKVTETLNGGLLFKNRGVKQAGFVILKYATMPSILVEIGYITNSKDREKMVSPEKQEEIAESISNAILDYISATDL